MSCRLSTWAMRSLEVLLRAAEHVTTDDEEDR
jgi:hypothetical protein